MGGMGGMSSNGFAIKLRTHTMAVSSGDSGESSMVSVYHYTIHGSSESILHHFLENISIEYMDFFDGVLDEMSRYAVSGVCSTIVLSGDIDFMFNNLSSVSLE